jgi:hypothetical protein
LKAAAISNLSCINASGIIRKASPSAIRWPLNSKKVIIQILKMELESPLHNHLAATPLGTIKTNSQTNEMTGTPIKCAKIAKKVR